MIVVWPQFTKGDANFNELAAANAMMTGDIYNAFSDRGRAIFWRQIKEKLFVLGTDSCPVAGALGHRTTAACRAAEGI